MKAATLDGSDERRDRELRCIACRRPFTWSASEQRYFAEREYETPRRCKPCRVRAREAKTIETAPGAAFCCRKCGGFFVFTDQERAFFHSQGLWLPKWCVPCRRAKQARREAVPGTTAVPS